jgi:hypothetical protein
VPDRTLDNLGLGALGNGRQVHHVLLDAFERL